MRIGEIKNIISNVIDENHKIKVDYETLFGGQAFKINNFSEIISALDILSIQEWNKIDYSQVKELKSKYEIEDPTILTTEDFNKLNSYINAINPQIPLYFSVLSSLTGEQDEKTVNIKLPSNINSLKRLNEINERIDDILKLFNVDGQFEFKGFDKGSNWLVVMGSGVLSYRFLISSLKIAQEFFKARTEYFKSEEARISYEVAREKKASDQDKDFQTYQEKWLKIFVEEQVADAIEKIGKNGQTKEELQTRLVKATTELIKELEEGTEFHLSLNPPSYVEEKGGSLKIDYTKIQALHKIEVKKQEQIESPKQIDQQEQSVDSDQ